MMSKKESELLDKLTRLAFGNSSLVEEAIRATSAGRTSVPLSKIVAYIKAKRDRRSHPEHHERERMRAAG